MNRKTFKANESYSFSRYFELPFTLDDILLDLGCTIARHQVAASSASDDEG